MGLLMQKITNLIIFVPYNCNFLISVKPYIGYKFNQVVLQFFKITVCYMTL